jgi:hypothetical protein
MRIGKDRQDADKRACKHKERERDGLYNGKNAEGNGRIQGHLTVLLSDSLQDLLLAKKIKKE